MPTSQEFGRGPKTNKKEHCVQKYIYIYIYIGIYVFKKVSDFLMVTVRTRSKKNFLMLTAPASDMRTSDVNLKYKEQNRIEIMYMLSKLFLFVILNPLPEFRRGPEIRKSKMV